MSSPMTQPEVRTSGTRKMDPTLSIILVCWNNKAYLDPCLKSLYDSGMKNAFDVVVVDNGSTDGSQQMLKEKYPEIKIIQNTENVGLGKASNQGIEATIGKYVLLLNNDTIVNGASFDEMVDFLDQNPRAGAVGGKLLNSDGTVQACYNYFSTLKEEFFVATRLGELIRPGYPAIMNAEEVTSVEWLGSACLMLRRSALDEVGLLDEGYFIYGDEADLQYRLKKAGWHVYYLPHATTIHFGGRSMDRWKRRKMVYRGKMIFYEKNYGQLQAFLLRLMLGILSITKLTVWGITYIVPTKREQASKELRSNLEVIQLCVSLT
jgi:N-acetylglucosaminyl-diphospho-decaprenol L-rhamnosyltransferase